MATLYVENVPKNRYEALRKRATQNRRSITAEILDLLDESYPTEAELRARRQFVQRLKRLRSRPSPRRGPFPSTEEMVREDRGR